MKYLLDTNAFLWHLISPDKLNDAASQIISAADSQLLLSIASVWEISIKHGLGRLQLPTSPAEFVASRIVVMGASLLPIELRHITALGLLPPHHRDPFDRMLVAQATADGLQLITSDSLIGAYEVPIVWAAR